MVEVAAKVRFDRICQKQCRGLVSPCRFVQYFTNCSGSRLRLAVGTQSPQRISCRRVARIDSGF
jgi:hypothetical protein